MDELCCEGCGQAGIGEGALICNAQICRRAMRGLANSLWEGAPVRCYLSFRGARETSEPGTSRFPGAQPRTCGLVLRTIPE